MLKPNKKYILVEPIKQKQTESGILLPDQRESINQGKVIAIGGIEQQYSVGDTVIFKYGIPYKEILIVNKQDIIGYETN